MLNLPRWEGDDLVEYALILVLTAITVIAMLLR
jgi:Flp pilus assembly pilin Flp